MVKKFISSIICVLCFVFVNNPAIAVENGRGCGDFSSEYLDHAKFSILDNSYKYRVTSKKFVDGWKKIEIIPDDLLSLEVFWPSEASISFLIARCLCGFNPRIGFLHRNGQKFYYRYRCDTQSIAVDYDIRLYSYQRILE